MQKFTFQRDEEGGEVELCTGLEHGRQRIYSFSDIH